MASDAARAPPRDCSTARRRVQVASSSGVGATVAGPVQLVDGLGRPALQRQRVGAQEAGDVVPGLALQRLGQQRLRLGGVLAADAARSRPVQIGARPGHQVVDHLAVGVHHPPPELTGVGRFRRQSAEQRHRQG